jgi:hypothetical protein
MIQEPDTSLDCHSKNGNLQPDVEARSVADYSFRGVASSWPAYGPTDVSIAATLKTTSSVICAGFAEILLTPH